MLEQEKFHNLRAFKAFTEVELLGTWSRKSPEHLAADASNGPALFV